ncbi:LysR family transcriptional regulator [Kribbella sp. NPDC003505]|uniref:LysR family transcriptional regulator n=1 Tax=Kribbella sp. NPDC003505 TaxID=3154448 RepID=UPI0033BC1447
MALEARVLRYFLVVAEESSFTQAASRLGIAQPALSAQIRRLESTLGVRLLDRTTRRVSLTPAGAVLVEHGPAALATLDAVWERARRVGAGDAGQVKIVYSPSTGADLVPRLITALEVAHPELVVVAEMLSTPEVSQAVAAGVADAGVTRAGHDLPGTRRVALRRETRGVVVAAGHPLYRRRVVPLAEVARYPLLLHSREANPGHYDDVLRLFAVADLEPQFVRPPVTFDPGHHQIRTGKAIGLMGESAANVLPVRTRWIPLADPGTEVTLYLVLRTGLPTPLQRRIRAAAGTLGRTARQA